MLAMWALCFLKRLICLCMPPFVNTYTPLSFK